MRLALCLVCLLVGCGSRPVQPEIRIVEKSVPVPVLREASAELKTCGDDLPLPHFIPATDAAGGPLVGLTQPEADKALRLIAGLDGCNRAWRAWAGE